MSWRTFVNLMIGFALASTLIGTIDNHIQSNKIHKIQTTNRIQQQMLFNLGCRTTEHGQTYCSTKP